MQYFSPSCLLLLCSRTISWIGPLELLILTSEWWLLREGRLRRSREMVELPPLLPPLAAQLERYLTQPELLPLHDIGPAQQSWWVKWLKMFLTHCKSEHVSIELWYKCVWKQLFVPGQESLSHWTSYTALHSPGFFRMCTMLLWLLVTYWHDLERTMPPEIIRISRSQKRPRQGFCLWEIR